MNRFFVTLVALVAIDSVSADIAFSGLDLNGPTRLVFSAQSSSPAQGTYRAWFNSSLGPENGNTIEALTFYPETVSWLPKPGQLLLQNRFGLYRLEAGGASMKIISPEAFEKKSPSTEGKLLPVKFSPDGQYVLYFQKKTPVVGDLSLYEIGTDKKVLVADNVPLSYRDLPTSWSPDGQFFLYEKNDELFYFSIKQLRENRVPDESLRRLGKGLLTCVSWGSTGELYYAQDQVLYRILPEEFFTRSIYGARFQTWGIIGKLPFPFHPQEDSFWLAGDRKNILFNLGGRTLFLYPLEYLDFYQTAKLQPLTYIPLPQNLAMRRVLWGSDGRISILTASLSKGSEVTQILRLSGTTTQFVDMGTDRVLDLTFSPDEKSILVTKTTGFSIRDEETFAESAKFAFEGTVAGFWKDNKTLIASGRTSTVQINVGDGSQRLLFLGDLDEVGAVDKDTLAGRQGKNWYVYQGKGIWQLSVNPIKLQPAQSANDSYRVYAEDLGSGPYKNWILVRDLKALITLPLFPRPSVTFEPFPTAEEPLDPTAPFSHGPRFQAREISLAIDALDSSDGLPEVLRTLQTWGFQTTFFVNGEFLRRNPQAAQEIAASPHEYANMFHIRFDLTDPKFIIDKDFIRQGLARQEDDWYRVTGKELTLLWHAPYWVATSTLQDGARAANYQTIGCDVTYPMKDDKRVDTSGLILNLLKSKKPGSIIPLTLGMKDSTTGESFFNRLDLLLNALVESGYRVVPVSILMDRTRK